MLDGFCCEEEEGFPPLKTQFQLVEQPELKLVKLMHAFKQITVSLAENAAPEGDCDTPQLVEPLTSSIAITLDFPLQQSGLITISTQPSLSISPTAIPSVVCPTRLYPHNKAPVEEYIFTR